MASGIIDREKIFYKGFFKAFILVVVLLVIFGIHVFIAPFAKTEKIKANDRMVHDKKYDSLVFKNIEFLKKGRRYFVKFKVVNNKKQINNKKLYLIFINSKGKVLYKNDIVINSLDKEESKIIKKELKRIKIKDVYKFLIEVK